MTFDRIVLLLAACVAAPALAQPPPGAAVGPEPSLPSVQHTEIQPPAPKSGPYLAVPPDATLVGEVKPFVHATDDRTFRSTWSFSDAVRFYDEDFKQRGTTILSRQVAPDGVTFRVRRGDGQTATVVVRKSNPTTIETREPL